MDEAIARLVAQTYVDGWREGDHAKILSSLDEECIIIESYWADLSWDREGGPLDKWLVGCREYGR